jgi:GTP cyclohydrolase II
VAALISVQMPDDWSVETVLPIEFNGREVTLEAHAYRGDADEEQVLVLVHRSPTAVGAVLPVVRIHSGCVTGDIFHSLRCDC